MLDSKYCGIDFGTSNCSVGVWKDGAPSLLDMEEGSTTLASVFYTAKADVAEVPIDGEELARRVQQALREQERRNRQIEIQNRAQKSDELKLKPTEHSEEHFEGIERGRMRREAAERARVQLSSQTLEDALTGGAETLFGRAALKAHLEAPTQGYFTKSPKSFLAAELSDKNLKRFTEIVTRMLVHLRGRLPAEAAEACRSVVLGRPVKFHGTTGKVGEAQALNILRTAASAAGFAEIEFLEEPIAAALAYEQTIDRDHCVLVFDAGGGTTDCSMVMVGPSWRTRRDRSASVLATVGERIGGNDLDMRLAARLLLPHLGKGDLLKDGREIPSASLFDAIEISDVNAQLRFLSAATGRWIRETLPKVAAPRRFTRFARMHEDRNNIRLIQSAESAKIRLSTAASSKLDLRYLEKELFVGISREQFDEAVEKDLAKMIGLLQETQKLAQVKPDVIFVTGGTGRSPVIREHIRKAFGEVELVAGDDFGSVATGLTIWANRLYGVAAS